MDDTRIILFRKVSLLIKLFNKLTKTDLYLNNAIYHYNYNDIRKLSDLYSCYILTINSNKCFICDSDAYILYYYDNKYYCWYHSFIKNNIFNKRNIF
jgi:hypothetical protein